MKFGKVEQPEQVDFRLPPEPAANSAVLAKYQRPTASWQLFIGATGWSMPEWKGKWYPPKTNTKAMLRAYAQQFNTIELNTTHYRIPGPEMVQRWVRETPADFRFCPKVPQRISHSNNLGLGTPLNDQFLDALALMNDRLGCTFIQLPPYFDRSRLDILKKWLFNWPSDFKLAVELRHPSWFESQSASEALFDLLEARKVAAVITDVAGRRDVLHLRLTAPYTMIRFVGNGLIQSDYDRINAWTEVLQAWQLPEVYFFPHEPDNLLAPDLAAYLHNRLESVERIQVRGPQAVSDGPGPNEQISLF